MRKLISILLVLVLAFGLVACAGETTNEPSTAGQPTDTPKDTEATTPTGDAEAADPDDPARFAGQTLKIAAKEGGYGSQYWRDLGDMFEAAYPGVTVEIQSSPNISDITRPQIIAGAFPDLYYSNRADQMYQTLIDEKLVEDLTDVYEQNLIGTDIPLKDMITEGVLDMKTIKPYSDDPDYIAVAPNFVNVTGLYYNMTLFEKNGWEVPTTWDEFFALGDLAKEQGIALFTYPGNDVSYNQILLWPAIASAAGIDAVNAIMNYEQGSISGNETVMEVLRNFGKIADGYLLEGTPAMTHTQIQSELMLDRALFVPNGSWLPNEMADAPRTDGFQWALAPALRLNEDDPALYRASVGGSIIPSQAEHKELAKEFIRFMYTDEAVRVQAAATIPVCRKDLIEIAGDVMNPDVVSIMSISEVATAMQTDWATLANSKIVIGDYVWNPVNDMMNGDITVDQWVASMEEMFTRIAAGE